MFECEMWLGQIIKVAFVWGAKHKKIFGVVPNQFGFGAAAEGKRDEHPSQ